MSDRPHKVEGIETDWAIADHVFIKQIVIDERGAFVPQHSHKYPHVTFLAAGAIRVWKDKVYDADYAAPCPIVIPAGVKHLFQTLEDRTVILCIHNGMRLDVAAVLDEHEVEL